MFTDNVWSLLCYKHFISDAARRKIRRSEESIITLQQERQDLLEKNVKSEKLIQSLQVCIGGYLYYIHRIYWKVHLPKAELLLHDADGKIAAAKQSVTVAKELLSEFSMKESSNDRGTTDQCISSVSEELNMERSLPFNPVMASTPQHSPPRVKDDVNIHGGADSVGESFDVAAVTDQFQYQELSDNDTPSFLSPLQDVPTASPIIEIEEEPSFKMSKSIKSMIISRTPRPKRHCTELATSYAEDDLMRYGNMNIIRTPVHNLDPYNHMLRL